MGKQKVSPKILAFFIISIILLVIAIPVFTYAWFTDSKSYSNTLSFGEISLDVKSGVNETAKTVTFNVTRTNGSYATGGKIYPGDTVNISVGLSVKSTSGPAYYLIYLTDTKGYFKEGAYFSDGTNVYFNNGTTTINQSTSAEVTDKYVGGIASSSVTHTVNMKAVIDTALDNSTQNTSTDITLKIYAIQQYNLTESDAQGELNYLCYGITKEYSKVRYLQSNCDGQYIDTGIFSKPNISVAIEVSFDSLKEARWFGGGSVVMAVRENENEQGWLPVCVNNVWSDYYKTALETNKKYEVRLELHDSSYELIVNDEIQQSFERTINTETNYSMSLFEVTAGSLKKGILDGRIYSCKISDGDTLVRNFIPCVRKSDSKPGLFDVVNGQFYTNAGTGEFSYN